MFAVVIIAVQTQGREMVIDVYQPQCIPETQAEKEVTQHGIVLKRSFSCI